MEVEPKKKLMVKNLCIVFTAMDCSQKELCGDISRSANSSLRVIHLKQVEKKKRVQALCAFAEPAPVGLAKHTGSS